MSKGNAIVTGASRGIGAAIARRLAADGYDLTLVARNGELLQTLATELPGQTYVHVADLADPAACDALIPAAESALGPVEVLVNNAGVQYVEPVQGVTPDRVDRLFTININSPMRLSYYALQTMLERGSGCIVNITSMAGVTHTPGMAHYNGTKAALAAYSESMRVELSDTGVHVLTVYPGPVESDLEAAGRAAFAKSFLADSIPTGKPDALAALISKGIAKGSARIFYPQIYGATRYTRVLSQWFTDNLTPPLAGDD